MNTRTIIAASIALVVSCGHALAWGHQGHEVVGVIADQLLKPQAKKMVKQYLGFELRVAAPWADCVRSVVRHSDGSFEYAPSREIYRIPCRSFETAEETARMVDYVRQNWNACDYRGGRRGCQDTYHFADVDIRNNYYKRTYVGTNNHDIVGAINASIEVLKGHQATAPFKIRDKKEALFLLAHFVGDLHEPLHVGAVYLTRKGKRVHPDSGKFDPATETHGGNLILESVNEKCEGQNLHSDWDGIPKSFQTENAFEAMVEEARAEKHTSKPVEEMAVIWASESVVRAQSAFEGLRFTRACRGYWLAHFRNKHKYNSDQRALKRTQLIRGGARLAELLNTIWP